jgi:hypothetical protein
MALTVAGTRFPPSYCASFLAAKIDAAISSTRTLRPSTTPYTMKPAVNLEGDYGKSTECAPATSCRAQPGADRGREVRSSDFRHRVFEWYRSIPQGNATDPNRIGGFAAEDGAGAKGEMGKIAQAFSAKGEDNQHGPSEAHNISSRQKENRGGAAGAVGAGEGGEEVRMP